jgi:hypothetical protein
MPILALASCTTVNVPAPKQYASTIDYAYLSQKGIFVTESNSVNFDYEPLGSIYVECTGGWVKKKYKEGDDMEDIYMTTLGSVKYLPPTFEDAYQLILSEVKKLRANGVINLKIRTVSEYQSTYKVYVDKIIITGMCIRK